MKLKIQMIAILFCMTIVFSCKKQNLPPKPQPSPFSAILQNTGTILSSGGEVLVDIKAGSNGWWIVIPTEAKTWCSSSQLFGSGDKTVTLTFSKNTTGASRLVIVQFNPTFDLPAESFTFQQE